MGDPDEKLLTAATMGDLQRLTACLASGANPNAADSLGMTPLIRAAISGQAACAEALLAAGADASAADTYKGCTALHAAAQRGHIALVAALLAAGANPMALTLQKETPLHCAVGGPYEYLGSVACVRQLLAAAPEAALVRDSMGSMPLEIALQPGRLGMAHCLLAEGPLEPSEALQQLHTFATSSQYWGIAHSRPHLPLYALVAARQPLTAAEWALVPSPCPPLCSVLPTVLERSASEAAHLLSCLPAADRARLQVAACCLAAAQRQHQVQLPTPLVWRMLAMALS